VGSVVSLDEGGGGGGVSAFSVGGGGEGGVSTCACFRDEQPRVASAAARITANASVTILGRLMVGSPMGSTALGRNDFHRRAR
jgi:hypothetical protein